MTGKNRKEKCVQKSAVKKLMGIALFVVAGVFGGVLSTMPMWAAFAATFGYISVQAGIWML